MVSAPQWFSLRQWLRSALYACTAFLLAISLMGSLASGAASATELATTSTDVVSLESATARLKAISEEMRYIHFCKRSSCSFRNVQVKVTPAETTATPAFIGRIDAVMDRPSTMEDLAHYNFEFVGDRWILTSGEELSDVSSFSFKGGTYEVYSAYNGRHRTARLNDADTNNLRVGYRDLYYTIMNAGAERTAADLLIAETNDEETI